jgi:hydrogenase maturation protease
MNAVVIGYGNDLRGDDGIGPYLARRIAEGDWPGVQALVVHQLTPELADAIADADVVVFVDAVHEANGELVAVRRVQPGTLPHLTGHTSDPRALLALCVGLHGRAPAAWLVTIGGREWAVGASLSSATRAALPMALQRIEALLQV